MELFQLRYFQTAAKHEHFTRAAEILGISQPALTAAIRRLESEMGVKLFEKNGRNIRLTQCGNLFLTYTNQALASLDSGISAVADLKRSTEEAFTLYAPSMRVFGNLLEYLLFHFPGISISDVGNTSGDIRTALLKGTADLCISSDESLLADSIAGQLLTTEKLAILCSIKNPLSDKSLISARDLVAESWAAFPDKTDPYQRVMTLCQEAGFSPNIAFTSPSLPDIVQAVRIRNCVALMSLAVATKYCSQSKELKVFPLESERLNRYIYWNRKNQKHIVTVAKDTIVAYFLQKDTAELTD